MALADGADFFGGGFNGTQDGGTFEIGGCWVHRDGIHKPLGLGLKTLASPNESA